MTNIAKRIVSSYNKFTAPITKEVQNYLRRSNIPAFSIMLKKLDLGMYFYNHDVIAKALGDNVVLLNNLVFDCLVDAISKSIYDAVNNTTNVTDGTKVGWWTMSSITDVVRMNASFAMGGDDEAMYFVSYAFEAMTQETIDQLTTGDNPKVVMMKFSDFQEDRFNEVVNKVIENSISVLEYTQAQIWPEAFKCGPNEELRDHLVDGFITTLEDVRNACAKMDDDDQVIEGMSPAMSAFTRAVSLFVSTTLANGGVGLDTVVDSMSKSNISYSDTVISKGKKKEPGIILIYSLKDNPEINVSAEFPTKLIENAVNNDIKDFTKTYRAELGTKLRGIITDYCHYVFLTSED